MSWLFSQALVEASSAATSLDGAPSAPLSGSPTQLAYLPPDRMTTFSRPSRSGMTFRPLTDDLGAAVLTWCLEASRARTSAWPAKAQESTGNDQACGATWRGSLARFDPATSLWRTAQPSLLEDLGESSVIWPRSGMTADGQCWELPTLERRIKETGSGLWATPSATDGQRGGTITENMTGVSLAQMVKTPARWPTPTTRDRGSDAPNRTGGPSLAVAVKTWPTPVACMSKGSSPASLARKDGQDRSGDRLDHAVMATNGGHLNPTWVEWLMGWPLGWTDLKPLETDRCPCVPQPLGECLSVADAVQMFVERV